MGSFMLGLGLRFKAIRSNVYRRVVVAWSITAGDGEANISSFPNFVGSWSITPTDSGATINTFPEVT